MAEKARHYPPTGPRATWRVLEVFDKTGQPKQEEKKMTNDSFSAKMAAAGQMLDEVKADGEKASSEIRSTAAKIKAQGEAELVSLRKTFGSDLATKATKADVAVIRKDIAEIKAALGITTAPIVPAVGKEGKDTSIMGRVSNLETLATKQGRTLGTLANERKTSREKFIEAAHSLYPGE